MMSWRRIARILLIPKLTAIRKAAFESLEIFFMK